MKTSIFGKMAAATLCVALTLGTLASCKGSASGVADDSAEGEAMAFETFSAKDTVAATDLPSYYEASVDFPSGAVNALKQNICEWMNEVSGGEYAGDWAAKVVGQDFADFLAKSIENDNPGETHSKTFKMEYQNDKFVSYTYSYVDNFGTMHPVEGESGMSFRKSDGRRLEWGMFTKKGMAALPDLLKNAMLAKYPGEMFNDNSNINFPLPQASPVFLEKGVRFIYQNGEGLPEPESVKTVDIPYDSLTVKEGNMFSRTAAGLIVEI